MRVRCPTPAAVRVLLAIVSSFCVMPPPMSAQSTPTLTPTLTPLPDSVTMQREYRARRDALARRLGDGIVIALGARAPEHDYLPFFQSSDFLYLTGWREPNAILVMVKKGETVASTLFVTPRNVAREVWSGAVAGPEAAARITGMSAKPRPTFEGVLDTLAAARLPVYVIGHLSPREGGLSTYDDQFVALLRAKSPLVRVSQMARRVLSELRGRKSAAELSLIERAAAITVGAHREALGALEPGMNEFELQALVEYTFRRNGADRPSFASIIGSGPNSTTLHYNANDRFIQPGDLVVMDIGASFRGYAADVTRTLPATGRFTPEQRAIYQIVRDAQAAAERQAKPGTPAQHMADSARAVIANGLARVGLIDGPDGTYDCGSNSEGRPVLCPQVELYYMHGLGHGIGLDVHDPDQYDVTRKIDVGSAFTIEPGIYVRASLLDILPDTPRNRAFIARIRDAVRRYTNVGVRIEDDYIVTEHGTRWISPAPREIAEIERLMQQPYTGPARREAPLVESYRGVP
jgi:Xaa-Pro aminopeptidase